jgi:hypothetical protein
LRDNFDINFASSEAGMFILCAGLHAKNDQPAFFYVMKVRNTPKGIFGLQSEFTKILSELASDVS